MKKNKYWVLPLLFCLQLFARESITSRFMEYRKVCQKAAEDPYYLDNFRSIPEFRIAFEISHGEMFAEYINCSERLLGKIEAFRKMERIGNPVVASYPNIGSFSATTLRYICLADQLLKMTPLPKNPVIAEIGAGFGGQCYVLAQLHPFSKYYFFDLPEVESLIAKMMEVLQIENTCCIPMEEELPEEKIDLVISNYAFSECDREIQMEYFKRILLKADRGFIVFNQIADFGLTLDEFVQLLKDHGFRPRVFSELLSTAPGNRLIVWNRCKR
jgi:hypothetical protein